MKGKLKMEIPAQGFLQSIVTLMAPDLPVPNYSTVSRRQSAVDVRLSVRPTDRPRHVVIDSTGLKIYGAGEWHIRKTPNPPP